MAGEDDEPISPDDPTPSVPEPDLGFDDAVDVAPDEGPVETTEPTGKSLDDVEETTVVQGTDGTPREDTTVLQEADRDGKVIGLPLSDKSTPSNEADSDEQRATSQPNPSLPSGDESVG